MSAKHTPGPWSYDPQDDIARVYGPGDLIEKRMIFKHCYPIDEEDIANARLIAAAPDLLAFARYFLDSESTTAGCDRMAKAAITKAQGGKKP